VFGHLNEQMTYDGVAGMGYIFLKFLSFQTKKGAVLR
jgi:hypothetical protein